MSTYTTPAQLQKLIQIQERRTALAASFTPVLRDTEAYYHESDIRQLYPPGFTFAFTEADHLAPPWWLTPTRPFAWEVRDESGALVATHRAYCITQPTPYGIVVAQPHQTGDVPLDTPPPASAELLLALLG
jgi:hypothetical protein